MKYQIMMDIFFTLLAKKKVSAGELAAKHDVSTRSIYRYVDELTIAGIPVDIQQGRGGGIYISDAYKLPVNYMSEKEYLAAISAMQAMQGQIEDEALVSAINKLSSQVKRERTEIATSGDVVVDSSSWGDYRFHEKIKLLQECAKSRESLLVEYVSRSGEHTKRTIEPHVLVFKQNVWYVYAYCGMRKEFRLFKIGRIKTARKTGEHFEKRQFSREDIPLQFRQEVSERVEIKLEFTPSALLDAEEWLGVESIRKGENQLFYAVMELPDDEGLIHKIISLGTGVKVVYPERVKEAVKKRVKEIISYYE